VETKELRAQRGAGEEAKNQADKVLNEGLKRAETVCKEAKKQADIVYKEAKKLAVDKAAKKELDKAHKEALKEAEKVREAIKKEVWVVWHGGWDQRAEDLAGAVTKSGERIDRAEKAYEETKKQADMVHEEAGKLAVDEGTKKEADAAHKEALKEADKIRKETQE